MHERNSFVTLTYNDAHLPGDRGLSKIDLRNFMKRLRKRHGAGIRFLAAGEYGGETQRPHYHMALFGLDFSEDRVKRTTRKGHPIYTSKALAKAWTCPRCHQSMGFHEIGSLTYDSAFYVAGYVMKKRTGEQADQRYRRLDLDGYYYDVVPEFAQMSLRPGLGARWFEKYWRDCYPHDYVVVNGKKRKPPAYYDELLKREHPDVYDQVKEQRLRAALARNDSVEQREAAEATLKASNKLKVRSYEDSLSDSGSGSDSRLPDGVRRVLGRELPGRELHSVDRNWAKARRTK